MILRREPTLILQLVSVILALVVTFGLTGLSAENAGAIVALGTALIGVVNAIAVRPMAPAAFTAVVATGATLLATYGLELSAERIGLVQTAVTIMLALITRASVTPVNDQANTAPTNGEVR